MDRESAHGQTPSSQKGSGPPRSAKPDMGSARREGQLRTLLLLIALSMQPQAACAVGMFELQIRHFQNVQGLLQTGECCDLPAGGGPRCRDPCDTFFRACLKEYQSRVAPVGTCTFGSGSTGVLGGNSQTLRHHGHEGGGGGGGGAGGGGDGGGLEGTNGHIVIPFKYAWPKSFSLVLDVLDFDNDTSESGGELIERVLLSSMLNPGEQWQPYRHHGPALTLEYRLRFRCDSNYYGPFCNKFCRARDDFFGHFACEPSGTKVCKEGWTGPECREAVCRQGCHQSHGSCTIPGECKCQYGWQGPLCDQCETYPGCVYGTCVEPWQCVCDVNWGGLLCDKDLNPCGNHQPCQNGGTCSNTEPNEYRCECQDGFRGRDCDIVEHACLSSPCTNGAPCVEDPTGFSCVCPEGWTGHTCAEAVRQCDLSPCGRGATCQESPEGFRCLCPPGWMGRTCQLDTNECEAGVCVNARSCHNLIGGYLCDCLPGWSGPDCDITNSSCSGLCLNGGHCQDLVSGSKCVCLAGFTGKYCETGAGACDSAPCLNGGQCVEHDGQAAVCNCPLGYSGSFCEVVLDLCNPNPCQQGVPCHSLEGRYTCACPDGFYTNKCLSLMDPCIGQHCPGAISDTVRGGGLSLYMVLVGVSALVTVCCCTACAFLLSFLLRRRKRKQTQAPPPPQEAINNQRELATLIRNVERPFPLLPPPPPPLPPPGHQHHPDGCRRHEEIELTRPPSPAPSQASPAMKPAVPRAPKQDISNLEREKLNRFNYTDTHPDLEV